jgi:ABC-type dipeptide/oligopeptide/nickel transport system permease subunit
MVKIQKFKKLAGFNKKIVKNVFMFILIIFISFVDILIVIVLTYASPY